MCWWRKKKKEEDVTTGDTSEEGVEVVYPPVMLRIPCRYCGGAETTMDFREYNPNLVYGIRIDDPYGGEPFEACGACLRGLLDFVGTLERESEGNE
jgi:hypothetical protein